MKLHKKTLCLALTISLLCTTLLGCEDTSSTPANSTTGVTEVLDTDSTENASDVEVEEIERVKITYWDNFCANMMPDSYVETLIEAALPVDIVVNRTDDTNGSQVAKLFDPKYMPDVMWYGGGSRYVIDLDITRTIPYEMMQEYAPSFLELYDQNPSILTAIMDPDNQDEFFALTGTTDQSTRVANNLYADFYRYDWIQALDIDLGVEVTQLSDNIYVADSGLTLDKFEEVMHAFTYGDPDGNGVDDTFGATFEGMQRFDLLYSAFDMISGVNEFDEQAHMYYATDMFKEFAKWFCDMFDKGYIDEEFFFQDRNARWANIEQERSGYFLESSIAINSWAIDRPPLSMAESLPEATFLLTPGLSDNDGNATMIKNEMPTQGYLCYINKDVDDEKLALILQTLEYINFGEEKLSMWFGEEGVDWEFDENNNVVELNTLQVSEKGSAVFVRHIQTGVLFDAVTMQPTFKAGADFWLDDCIWRENVLEQYQYKLDLRKETDYDKVGTEYGPQCTSLVYSYFEDWVYNGLDVDSSWDDYLQELDDAGYNIMMQELNKVEPLEEMILDYLI